ncbi:MAG: thiamine phosphate synthase, partial [Armatimonadota bacterium]|nr:thiamine phosphate synthase [Armatimonadota bacterium]
MHRIAGIYVITDEQLVPGRTHIEIASAAISGGARIIQLRDKIADDSRLIEVGSEIARITSQAGALFIVNDRVEVAAECGADGVHIGQEDQPIQEVRKLLPDAIIGVSASTVEEAISAEEAGADYIGVGSIFKTS